MRILLFVIFFSLTLGSYSQNFRDSTRFVALNLESNNRFGLFPYYDSEGDTIPYSTGFYRWDKDTLVCFPVDFYPPDSSGVDADTAYYKFYFYEKKATGSLKRMKRSMVYDSKDRRHYSDSMEVMKIKKCKLKDNFLFLQARERSIIFYHLYFPSSPSLNRFTYVVEQKDWRFSTIHEPLRFKVSSKDSNGIMTLEFLNPSAIRDFYPIVSEDSFKRPIILRRK
jgi:hypothetical protein